MEIGEIVYIVSRLALGALAAFFAIVLWSKTRDVAWMLMVAGAIAAYVETVYAILKIFGIAGEELFTFGSVSLVSLILTNLPTVFFIAAFVVMIARKSRRR
ncbi:MAG: hypothetical protein LBK40_01860 [Spirochaetaceae bacterium]|jgi:hypothetical protein|nr:hypothetical protein [Spirochaetaceae bacterium]